MSAPTTWPSTRIPPAPRPKRYVVDDVEIRVATERVQYLDEHGKLITESLKDYSRKTVRKIYASLDALLQKYADSGITSVESLEILKVDPLTAHGTPVEIVKFFGGRDGYLSAIRELETVLYQKAS